MILLLSKTEMTTRHPDVFQVMRLSVEKGDFCKFDLCFALMIFLILSTRNPLVVGLVDDVVLDVKVVVLLNSVLL